MKLAFAPDAERELEAIIDSLFEFSEAAANRFADAFDETAARLVAFPYSGPVVVGGFRMALVGSTGYLVGYQVVADTVRIMSVRHGSQRK